MKEKSKTKRIVVNFLKIFTLVWLTFHFVMTFIYVMPVTPIKLEHQRLLNATIGTFFPQNWSLFAPNPLSRNESLLVMCIPENAPISTIESLPSENWEDITVPLWQGLQRNRFTAYDRLARTQGGVIRQYFGSLPELESWSESCRKGSEESCKYYEERVSEIKKIAETRMVKIASSYCKAANSTEINQVAIRIRTDVPLTWSQRYTDTKKIIDSNVGIFPIDDTVIESGVYQAKRRY